MTGAPDASPTPRTRRPTMSDVARAAGVSRQLVSIIMRDVPGASPDTRARVQEEARRLGYLPDDRARKLRQQSTKLIGITFTLHQAFHGDVVEHSYLAAADTGYELTLSAVAASRSEAVAVEALLRERCDAVILLAPSSPLETLHEWAAYAPLVTVGRREQTDRIGLVRSDDTEGMEQAVRHLAQLGHRRIAHIDGAEVPGAADRRASYRATMRRLGLAEHIDLIPGGPSEEDGVRGALTLFDRPAPPSAVITFNDRCATGVLNAAARAGVKVPAELSVVGYDDSRPAGLPHVQLTTVSQDLPAIARAAVEMALAQIEGTPPREVIVRPRLVVRGTTCPPADTQAAQ